MAEQVIDLIHRLSFELTGKGIDEAIRKLKEQAAGVDQLKVKEKELTEQMRKANSLNVNDMQRISNERAKTRKLIEQETTALRQNFAANKQLQTALNQEIGIIQRLETELSRLGMARKAATSRADISAYDRQIKDVQKQLGSFAGGSKLNQVGGAILSGLGVGAGFGLVTQGVSQIKEFISESIRLANETEGISKAFQRLDDPNLLKTLRASVRGTVSDLELMRNAVKFDNLGLPLNRMGEALQFVRQRARDTGMDVEKLVEALTLGIANKSYLRLDNLGLSAARLREEFKRTGDFAQAAFNIISEESAKAGVSVDTLADKTDQLNARIQNQQAEIGKSFSQAGLLFQSFIADFITEGNFTLTKEAVRFLREQEKIQAEAANKSVDSLNKYLNEYDSADTKGRNKIIRSATRSYQNILSEQKRFEQLGLQSTVNVLSQQAAAYRDFFTKITLSGNLGSTSGKVTFKNFTSQSLLGLTEEELNDLRKQGLTERAPYGAGDPEVKAINSRIRLIDAALDRFTIKIKTHKEKVKKEKAKPEDYFVTPEELEKIFKENEEKALAFSRRMDRIASSLSGTDVVSGPSGPNSVDSALALPGLFADARNDESKKDKAQKAEKKRLAEQKKMIDEYSQAYQIAANAIAQALDTIYQAQSRSLDNEIRIREQRVEAATELAERGNAELLNLERQRLEAAQEERERVARKQIAVNAALQVSNGLVAVARAASETGPYAAIAMIAAIIAALGAGYAAVQSLTADTEPGFREGVVGFKGKGTGTSDSNRVKISAGESIITAAGTEKNRAILEAINAGKIIDIPSYNIPVMQSSNSISNSKGIEKRLDALIDKKSDGIKSIGLKADVRGFSLAVEKHTYKNQKRNRR